MKLLNDPKLGKEEIPDSEKEPEIEKGNPAVRHENHSVKANPLAKPTRNGRATDSENSMLEEKVERLLKVKSKTTQRNNSQKTRVIVETSKATTPHDPAPNGDAGAAPRDNIDLGAAGIQTINYLVKRPRASDNDNR